MNLSPLHQRLHAACSRMTMRSLADATDTHQETVRRYMHGQAPSVDFLSAVCSKFGVSGEWLLTGRGPMRAADVKAAALKQANAAELLSAMAATLEKLMDRVDRLEVFVQTLDTRLAAGSAGTPEPARAAAAGVVELKRDAQALAAHIDHAASTDPRTRAASIADALAQRPRGDAGRAPPPPGR